MLTSILALTVNLKLHPLRDSEAGKAAAAREHNAKLKAEQDALLAAQAAERARKDAKKLRLERAESQAARWVHWELLCCPLLAP